MATLQTYRVVVRGTSRPFPPKTIKHGLTKDEAETYADAWNAAQDPDSDWPDVATVEPEGNW